MNRRGALFSLGAMAAAAATPVRALEMKGYPTDMSMDPAFLPRPAIHGGSFQVLTADIDRRTVTAVFDRLIPADDLGASASEAGCVEFLDMQLAGPFGEGASLYRKGPKLPNEDELAQTPQFIETPRERYATGLAALEAFAQKTEGASFADLPEPRQDAILKGMEDGTVDLGPDVNTKAFFELMLINVREGYFSDPIYGGNKDMVGWKMIGFPGARYDYRLYADRTGEDLGLEPVSLIPRD
ncbi:gluconate 2-dehydrogenase subunit 3 family protein [Falsirhodobacter sp. 20TX0035]|uniref:gluconate 2-dehydrogenase subunit 3 family protein n=1 Tax=Falsirhodobacter sp. 20TX0035 TaxID=3022019 RepID=UPI00232E355D|nr:gluconate 2-dehydrogenase subunit 3 family protein [Falsirhodobacter sp. 20TX0035]MDB6452736.1 gluconate 2-dehydrogenase subunit 3 family protein [Falsirhodobacter sp. 20TX0035]